MNIQLGSKILAFLCRMGDNLYANGGIERRRDTRARVLLPLVATEVDPDCHSISEPFAVVSRDISARGMGLLSARAVSSEYVRLVAEVPDEGDSMVFILRVLRCRPVGQFFDIGGEIVSAANPLVQDLELEP